jgi:hypothetical protein
METIAYQIQRSIGDLYAILRVQARPKSEDVNRRRDEPHDARTPKIVRHEVRASGLLRQPECDPRGYSDDECDACEHAAALSEHEV